MGDEFIKNVEEMRQKVIQSGGIPTTLKISQSAIEKVKLFGMDIEVVSSVILPKGVEFMVIEDRDKLI